MKTGFVQGSAGRIWYKEVGKRGKTPLLCLHGGPGFPSDYLQPLSALGRDRPVIFYDQSGCGRSDQIDPSFFTLDHFADEIDTVRDALGLKEVVLFGHSWGGLLAIEYLLRQPEGVESAILASTVPKVQTWIDDTEAAVRRLVKQQCIAHGKAMEQFDKGYRPRRPNAAYRRSQQKCNDRMYEIMWGPDEMTCDGNLHGYDRTGELSQIEVPVLITHGTFDGILHETATAWGAQMKDANVVCFDGAGHFAHLDYPGSYVKTLRAFMATKKFMSPSSTESRCLTNRRDHI
jgi:proline-specific peptidase